MSWIQKGAIAMTRADLEEYQDVIHALKLQKSTVVTDSVVGSSIDYPYTAHSITLHGVQCDDKTIAEVKRLEQKKARLDALIDGIVDERAKALIDMLYRKGMSWNEVEAKTNGSYNADVKYLQRFFNMSTIVHKRPDKIESGKVIITGV